MTRKKAELQKLIRREIIMWTWSFSKNLLKYWVLYYEDTFREAVVSVHELLQWMQVNLVKVETVSTTRGDTSDVIKVQGRDGEIQLRIAKDERKNAKITEWNGEDAKSNTAVGVSHRRTERRRSSRHWRNIRYAKICLSVSSEDIRWIYVMYRERSRRGLRR